MRIYVVDHSSLYRSIYFWVIDAEEKGKTYKVLDAWNYVGDGHGAKVSLNFLLTYYKKSDKRVFLEFEQARKKAIEVAEKMIEQQKEQLRENEEKLAKWRT